MPHSINHGDACLAYFNKIWGIPSRRRPLQIILATQFQLARQISVSMPPRIVSWHIRRSGFLGG
jgi:hypothetical protein